METAKRLREHMPAECMAAYGSMIYYPAMASLNLILMHIEAGWNAFYAKQGSMGANAYVASIRWRAVKDRQYVQSYHALAEGKWNHMMDSAHTGFRSWDAHNWTYPTVQEVIPLPMAKIIVGFRGGEAYHLGAHWQDSRYPSNDDFTRPDTRDVVIEIGSRGDVDFSYSIQCDRPWVCFDAVQGNVESLTKGRESVVVTCDRSKLKGRERALIEIDVTFSNGEKTVGRLGRRYGGRPFQTVRKLCYDSLRLMPEIRAVFGLWRKDFADKGSEDALFYDRYLGKPAERRPEKEGIVCMYDGLILHGGLTDRIRGLLTTYREAKRRGMPFYIHWDHPFRLEEFPSATSCGPTPGIGFPVK